MTHTYSHSELRKATCEAAATLAESGPHDEMAALTPVAARLGCTALDASGGELKFERAAVAAGLEFSRAMKEVVGGDGPDAARFIDVVKPADTYAYRPYNYLNRIISETFEAGWSRYEQADLAYAERTQKVYAHLLEADSTAQETSRPLGREAFRRGVEAGPEIAHFALLMGAARAKRQGICAMSAETFRNTVVRDAAVPWFRRRGSQHIRLTFQSPQSYQEVDPEDVELRCHPKSGRWTLSVRNDAFEAYDPDPSVVIASPTTGCFLQHIKIQPSDTYSAYDNMVFAGLNLVDELRTDAQHPIDLYAPEVAMETCDAIVRMERRFIAQHNQSFARDLAFYGGDIDKLVDAQDLRYSRQIRTLI